MKNKYRKADYIFCNGKVVTINPNNDVVEAAVVSDNLIAYAGSKEEAMKYAVEETRIIDLKGGTLLPGFIDPHIHVAHTGAWKCLHVNLDPSLAPDIATMIKIIKEAADKTPNGEWISCWGFDELRMKDDRMPTREEIDAVAPNNPVQAARYDGHTGVYNSKAFEIAGMTPASAANYVEGQVGVKDGKLTGLLRETAYYDMWKYIKFKTEDLVKAIETECNDIVKAGVTSAHDAGSYGSIVHGAYHEALERGLLKPRVLVMHFALLGKEMGKEAIRQYIKDGYGTYFGGGKLRYGLMKIMIDGSSAGPSAAVRQAFTHSPGNYGIMSWEPEEIDEIVEEIHRAGLQATAHAVGDKAVEAWISALEKAQAKYPRKDPRHRIEHCGVTDDNLIRRIKALGAVPIPNPRFIHLNGDRYIEFYGDRVDMMFPLRSFLEAGIPCAIGTDCSVVPENPLLGIASAISRKSSKGTVVGGNQTVSTMDAIRMYTYNGAYATFDEDKLGSIEPGKLADLTVVSGDILGAPAEEIEEMKCLLTMVDGEVVYSEGSL